MTNHATVVRTYWEAVLDLGYDPRVAAANPAAGFLRDILRLYNEPDRHYHRIDHIAHVLHTLADEFHADEQHGAPWHQPGHLPIDLAFAAIYHDLIYDPTATGNEAKSAEVARVEMHHLGATTGLTQVVSQLIHGTTHHSVWRLLGERTGHTTFRHAAMLWDADLRVLATGPLYYQGYVEAVRREYDFLTDEQWAKGRQDFLHRMNARSYIFNTPLFRSKHEDNARKNIENELAILRAA